MNTYLAILLMAVTTYLIRAVPFILFRREIQNRFIKSLLYYIPYACLTAMTIPAILYATDSIISAVAGLTVSLILGWNRKSLPVVAVAACAVVFITERLMGLL